MQGLEGGGPFRDRPLCHRHEGPGEVGQVGPGVRQVEGAGIDQPALRQVLGNRQVEPGALTGPIEIPGAQDDGAKAARLGAGAHLALEGGAQPALGVGGPFGRVLAQPDRHGLAVGVDISRQHEEGAQALGHIQALAAQRHHIRLPVGVGRVDGVNDDFGACGGGGQGLSLAEGDIQDLNARRQGRLGATGLGQDPPSGIGESLYGGGSKAAVGAKDKDGAAGHGDLLLRGGGEPVKVTVRLARLSGYWRPP